MEHDAAHAGVLALTLCILWEELVIVNVDFDGNFSVLKNLDLLLHECFVLFDSRSNDLLKERKVTLTTSNVDFWLHELD